MGGKKYIFIAVLGLLAFLPFVFVLNSNSVDDEMKKCIFCDIVQGLMPNTTIVYQTDEFIIFNDIKPASTHHFLAVPKRHIDSVKTLTKADDELVTNMENGLREFCTSKGIDTNDTLFGFHMPPFISVKHLHMHAISPRSEMTFTNRMMFRPGTAWFKTPDEIHRMLREEF